MQLSIVVPAYNEARRMGPTLQQLLHCCAHRGVSEVIVADDGSNDATVEIAEAFAREHPVVRVLRQSHGGKGHAVRAGMLAARGAWRLLTDADLSTPIGDLDVLLAAAERTGAAIVIGSRAVDRSMVGVHQPAAREWSGRLFNVAARALTRLPFRDTQCGFKLYRRDAAAIVFARQRLNGFAFDVEDLVIARRHHLPVVEVPVRWNNSPETGVSILAGARAFADLVRIAFNDARGRYA